MAGNRYPGPGPPQWVIEELMDKREKVAGIIKGKKIAQELASQIGTFLSGEIRKMRERNLIMAEQKKGKTPAKGYKGSKEILKKSLEIGKEGDDGFAPVYDSTNGEVWKFENDGDRVEGIYFDRFSHDGEFGESKCYKLYNPGEDKIFLVWSTFVIEKYLDAMDKGSYVRVEYKGRAGRAHNFNVALNKSLTDKYAAKAQELIAAAEKKETEKGEFPAM